MKNLRILLIALSLCGLAIAGGTSTMAGNMGHMDKDGTISVVTPANGALLDSGSGIRLTYKIQLSPSGNHLHVYVDDQPPIIDRNVSGCPCSLELPDLSSGMHLVTVKEARSNHSLTGVTTSVSFTVK